MTRKALGKGLEALLPEPYLLTGEEVTQINVNQIQPNPDQPRTGLDRDDDPDLEGLKISIQANGVIEPLIARRAGGAVQLVAGERRWRAARAAGLQTVPVIFREMDDDQLLEIALVENLQRESLNPIEEARGYEALMRGRKLTQAEIAGRVGKTRSVVANSLRLLKLPDPVRALLATGRISVGHAKVILGLQDEGKILELAYRVADEALSVRELESFLQEEKPKRRGIPEIPVRDPHVAAAEEKLRTFLSTKVRIVSRGGKGKILIEFHSEEELQRLYEMLLGEEPGH